MTFKVMTFNIRGAINRDGENEWKKRRNLNIATIKKYAPDIIGFQEAQQGNIDDYKIALPDYEVERGLLTIRSHELAHEQVPILWKHERFAVVAKGNFYLSETPDEQSIGWESSLERAATWVKLRDKTSNMELVALNTHFFHEGHVDTTRTHCANLIVRQLAQIAPHLPQVIMGDFNTQSTSEAYHAFIQQGYVDTYKAAGNTAEVNTYHGFKGDDYEGQSWRIDWILTRDVQQVLQCKSAQVILDAEPPLYPSDHYPVIAELDFA